MADGILDDLVPNDDGPATGEFAPTLLRRLAALIGRYLADERERWVLWLPVALGGGIVFYFGLAAEPAFPVGWIALAGACVLAFVLRRQAAGIPVCSIIIAISLGFTASQVRTLTVMAPILGREIGPVPVTGRVLEIDHLEKGARIVLGDLAIPRLASAAVPARVRVTLRTNDNLPPPGAMIRLSAVLHPPPDPAVAGAFDFGRIAFFRRIGAVGFAISRPEIIGGPEPGFAQSIATTTERVRLHLAERVNNAVSGADGAMASALLTGEQTAIPKTVMDDMRTSGLAHLLSISGLHVGLVAGLVMMVIRAGLALIPPVALRYPIKKWAAVAGMAAAFAYMLVVGSPVPTERSVLTTGLALGAILLDRNPLSLRLVACAAAAIMLLEPESLLGPSFQMSFGAVIALVAAFEVIRGGWTRLFSGAAWPVRIFLYIAGTVLTSVVASLATLPFSLFHFQQVQYFGVLANMIAVPITSFWVMPWGLIAYLALPLGLEEWPLEAMALGCRLIIATARTVAGLPGASQTLPAMPVAGLALITFGGLWLCLWSRSWRLLGLPAILLGLATVAFAPRPDILVTGDGKLMAVRDAGGRLMLSSQRAGRIARETWLRRDGVDSDSVAPSWPRTGLTPDGGLSCDALGCLYRTKGKTVALVKDRQALNEDCRSADLVISLQPARRCPAPHVVDRFDLWRRGAHAIYLDGGDGIRVETVRDWRGERPWTGGPPLDRPKVSDNDE